MVSYGYFLDLVADHHGGDLPDHPRIGPDQRAFFDHWSREVLPALG